MSNLAAELIETLALIDQKALAVWRQAVEKLINAGNPHEFMNINLVLDEGRHYYKVVRQASHGGRDVYAFIDKFNGDIFKPACWSRPAKHRRGNLFDDKAGLGWCGKYGMGYLR